LTSDFIFNVEVYPDLMLARLYISERGRKAKGKRERKIKEH
jgi:hypothetical protein